MELIFLVDGSNSVGYTSFDKMKAWIGDFIKNFDLSESTTRVGLVQYSDRISTRNGSIEFELKSIRSLTRFGFSRIRG